MLFVVEKKTFNDTIELELVKKFCHDESHSYVLTDEFPNEDMNIVIPIGSVDWCEKKYGKIYGPQYGIKKHQILPLNYPRQFNDFYGREIEEKTVKDFKEDQENITSKIFIKSADKYKNWKPFIYDYENKEYPEYFNNPDEKIYCCQAFDKVLNEWRYYISKGKLIFAAWYDGFESDEFYSDEKNIPEAPELPEKLQELLTNSKFSGVLDMGYVLIDNQKKFIIIETCHPYGIGWYSDDLEKYNDYCNLLISFDKFMKSYCDLRGEICPICTNEMSFFNKTIKLGYKTQNFNCHQECFDEDVFMKMTPEHFEICNNCEGSIYFYSENSDGEYAINHAYCYNCGKIKKKLENNSKKPIFNIKIFNEENVPIEELLIQVGRERILDYIEYEDLNLPEEFVEKELTAEDFDVSYSAEITEELKPKEEKNEKFFIEFENKERREINVVEIKEYNPPTFFFKNNYDNKTYPLDWIINKTVKLVSVVNKKEFVYDYELKGKSKGMSNMYEEDEERVAELKKYLNHLEKDVNIRLENNFYLFESESIKGYMLFADHGDQVVFRELTLDLNKDDLLYELYPEKKNSSFINMILAM